jgi:indolepyruvate decarboxylase
VAAFTYGAGALNAVNAIAAAYAERSPVVVISGAPGRDESESGLLLHHQAKTIDSQYRIYREITCDQVRLDNPAEAPALIARALASCKRESRPVYIELPRDLVRAPCGSVVPLPPDPADADALAAAVDEILARLGKRSPDADGVRRVRPRIGGASHARAKLGVPVVTSFMGRPSGADAPLIGT